MEVIRFDLSQNMNKYRAAPPSQVKYRANCLDADGPMALLPAAASRQQLIRSVPV